MNSFRDLTVTLPNGQSLSFSDVRFATYFPVTLKVLEWMEAGAQMESAFDIVQSLMFLESKANSPTLEVFDQPE